MNSIKTIIKYELIRYFLSPLAYVYLVGFLLLSGSCAIYFGHFFMDGHASLWGLFDYQPWIYLLFIPGIAMRSWAEEFHTKSIVQILTVPVSVTDLVWGKFLASWIFAIIAILLTFPFWITVNILGNPDNTVIIIGYLGCFILAGAMLAISQTMSALTKSPVIALVLGVFVNLLFFWSGFEYVLFWARELFSDVIVDTIISFSFLAHFASLSRGLVELRDLVFFGSLIVFFNLITIAIISLKTKGSSGLISSSSVKHGVLVLMLLFIGFFGLNIIANNVLRQISYDFTEEKYLSLTQNTKNILRRLERPVIAKLYYSPILGQRNPEVRQIFDRIKLILKQYKTYANGKFDYKIYTPEFLDKDEDRALAEGLQPIPLIDINQNALFGLSLSDSLTNKAVIPFFSIERLPFLEQDLTTNIYKMHHKKKTIGILSSLPINGGVRQNDVMMRKWEILKYIEELYKVKIIEKPDDLNQQYDVLMMVHPYGLSEDVIEKIKKQPKVLLLMDVADDASRLYSPLGGQFITSDISELADYWGIQFYDIGVAADFDNSITVDETINYRTNPSFTQDLLQFKVTADDFNPNHRTTYKLNNILFSSATMVMPKPGNDVLYFPLIKTSRNSSMLNVLLAKESKSPREVLQQYTPGNNVIVIAAEFLSNNPKNPFDVIAVGDTDFMYDAFWAKETKFLDLSYQTPIFDSANFIMNALDYLTENDDLISLRGKNSQRRPLYKVENMRKANMYRYKLKENDIFQAIDGAKQGLAEVIAKKNFEERGTFSSDELAVIGNIRTEIDHLRQQLSTLKLNANRDIEQLEVKVKFFNIYFVALIIIFIVLLTNLNYKKRTAVLCNIKEFFIIDRQTGKLAAWVAIIAALAFFSIYMENKNSISEYEGQPVFKDFSSKINDISLIKLKNSRTSLTLKKESGIWILEEYPNIPVYQERIRRFLIALNNMTFYEKKSDKIADMKYFGFSSLKNENSPTIEVGLYNNANQEIENFEIGWYDMDLGRGSKAAFIRLKNQFQVWEADADFYDLSLDRNAWTYSSLWNLRFGRLISCNQITDNIKVMNIAKILLNVYYQSISENIKGKKLANLEISAEHNNLVDLVFYQSDDGKYYVQYEFLKAPNGKHIEFFEKYVRGKYLEISKETWEKIKNDITGTK